MKRNKNANEKKKKQKRKKISTSKQSIQQCRLHTNYCEKLKENKSVAYVDHSQSVCQPRTEKALHLFLMAWVY